MFSAALAEAVLLAAWGPQWLPQLELLRPLEVTPPVLTSFLLLPLKALNLPGCSNRGAACGIAGAQTWVPAPATVLSPQDVGRDTGADPGSVPVVTDDLTLPGAGNI